MKARQPRLVYSGNFHGRHNARLTRDSKCLDATGPVLRKRGDGAFNSKVNLFTHQSLHHRGGPAIGHLLEPRASHALQEQAADVPDATDTDVTFRGLIWVGLQPLDKPV